MINGANREFKRINALYDRMERLGSKPGPHFQFWLQLHAAYNEKLLECPATWSIQRVREHADAWLEAHLCELEATVELQETLS